MFYGIHLSRDFRLFIRGVWFVFFPPKTWQHLSDRSLVGQLIDWLFEPVQV